ncbi:MAG: relaxase/mobilization nuclease domain-containing protein [Coleofasciculus sp. C3-bin4]|nr:relaxase/mobilization nuclease domain-containing protein [Coleofasciculus sp. C3-bin4]
MIVNQLKNKSFRTTAEYVLGKEEVELLDSNMLGATPRQMSAEVAACRRYRPNLQQATLHVIFSLPYRKDEQGEITYQEDLPDEKAVELVTQWREAMQVTNCLYFLARHRDRTHNHFHLVACRIRKDGSVVDDSWDYRRSEVVVRQLEKEFNLEPTPCSNERVAFQVKELGIETTISDRRAPTSKQKHHHSGQPTVKRRLAALIDEACCDSPTVKQLIGRLQHQGVTIHPQFSTRGLFKEAIAFELDGVKVAGNKIGSAYSFPGLLRKRGVSYAPEQDNPALQAAAAGEVVPREPEPLASTQLPIQHQEKEQPQYYSVKEGDSERQAGGAGEAEEKKIGLEESYREPQPEQNSQDMQLLAQQFYAHASRLWNQRKSQAKEVSPGKWALQGNRYAITYDTNLDHFWVSDKQRGVLVENKASKFSFTQQLTPEDVENFSKFVQQQQAQKPLPIHKPSQIER